MLEISACVAQRKDALVIDREKEVSSIIFVHVQYHVPKCIVLVINFSVNVPN